MRLDQIVPREQVTLPCPVLGPGIAVTVHVLDSAAIDKMRRACRPANAMTADEVQIDAWKRRLVDDVLVDVVGVEDSTGSPLAYTKEVGAKLIRNDKFCRWLVEAATDQESVLGEGLAAAKLA